MSWNNAKYQQFAIRSPKLRPLNLMQAGHLTSFLRSNTVLCISMNSKFHPYQYMTIILVIY